MPYIVLRQRNHKATHFWFCEIRHKVGCTMQQGIILSQRLLPLQHIFYKNTTTKRPDTSCATKKPRNSHKIPRSRHIASSLTTMTPPNTKKSHIFSQDKNT
ncbi:MAG TPA: hypothetical protein DCE42_25805 [Myxococcales bacterium]|nr:hypothetical protein [Deltaproteobacteria bacterium]MBU54408.1 hypothetical protein [Deltaproteobacteria bacterium]HAA58205.1 hypothetical protein [Myxococcales bacterium]